MSEEGKEDKSDRPCPEGIGRVENPTVSRSGATTLALTMTVDFAFDF